METLTKPQLTAAQSARKAELEGIVSNHIASFRIAGDALAEIAVERLWVDEFDTFKEYLDEKWGMSQSRAYQLMDAAKTAKLIQPMVELTSERAARALTGLSPEQKVTVAKRVGKKLCKTRGKGKVTSRIIEAEVVAVVGPRGGLAAQKREVESEAPSNPKRVEIAEDFSAAISAIERWYAQERNRLNEYPAASPERVITLLLKHLRG